MSEEKTAKGLLNHLKETGTSPARVELLEHFLKHNEDATPTSCVEWMLGQGWAERYHGTVQKAGIWTHGPGWVTNTPGVSAETELTARLEAQAKQIAELKAQVQQAAAENRRLRDRNSFLETRSTDAQVRGSERNPLHPSPEENKGKPAGKPASKPEKREPVAAGVSEI